MNRAKYAGCGKSYAACMMAKLGYSVLLVCPTNELIAQLKKSFPDIEGTTINKFFSYSGLDNDNIKMSKFDDYHDVIVFDESYFYDVSSLQRILHYCENSPEKIIIGAGDIFQLKPREISGNNINQSYIDDCINNISS